MKAALKYTLFLLIPVVLAVICFWRSHSVMNGYQDCSYYFALVHGFRLPSAPTNCADNQTLTSHYMFQYCGIGLLLLSTGVSIMLLWKKEYPGKEVIEQFKIVE
jgi:hypothetical protein